MLSDTDDLIDALEAAVLENYARIHIECGPTHMTPPSWLVSYKVDAGQLYATGGGTTLREAIQGMITSLVEKRLTT